MSFRSLLTIAAALGLGVSTVCADVRVWEGTLTLPTYEEGSPDRNPPFDQFSGTRFNYPYTLREDLTGRRADHAWRAVYLENEYLKCSVLPDIGGHLYTCVDKISGQSMFYANPSIKKANIGYRGAWAAFGVEFNFPVSHNWVSMSPVPYSYGRSDDGSAWVRVGNIDRNYGMEWTVELVLRPGSTVFEEHVTLNNRSDVRHRFYWWNNAGLEVKDDSRISYPMRFSAAHGFADVDTWPVDSTGTDLSIIRNQIYGPVSRFVYGSREPFMGVWRPDTRTGTVHYADYGALPGKKVWSFGADADGLDWRKALSDNNSAYVEVQAGLFRNQETYAFLDPRQIIRFAEYWMPVRGIGGISRANLAGVVHLSRSGDTLNVGLNVNRAYPGATVRILNGDRAVAEEKADLAPVHTWMKDVHPASSALYTVEVRDGGGAVILRHTEGEYDWTPVAEIHRGPQKAWTAPPPDQRTEDDWVEAGKDEELNGKLLVAMDTYTAALAKYPQSFALLKAAGRLSAGLLRYDEAVRLLEPAQARATQDPEVAYYLGLAHEGVGQTRQARAAYEAASRMPAYREAGSLRLAELLAREGHREEALGLLTALDGDVRVSEETVALENALGRGSDASALANRTLQSVPSLFLRLETAKKLGGDPDLLRVLAADPDRVLNIAAEYMRLGLYERALDVLSREYSAVPADESEPGALLPQNHPLVAYYRGYCRAKLGESPAADFARAEKLSTLYVFPSGAETLAVLEAASRANPNDATAEYLLGTHYFSRGQTEAALDAWAKARRLNPRLPVLHADIGRVLLNVKNEPGQALEAFREGVAADPSNVALYFGMDQAISLLAGPATDRIKALERYPDLASMPADLVYELALSHAEAGEFDAAEALFRNRFFPRREGGTNVRGVWIEVKARHALALADAGKCDAALAIAGGIGAAVPGLDFTQQGLDPFVQSARTEYLLGSVESRCGHRDEALGLFGRAAKSALPADLMWAHRAARELPGYDDAAWRRKLEAAVAPAEEGIDHGYLGSWGMYVAGTIYAELGRTETARQRFTQALLLPDRLLAWHLTRVAMAESGTRIAGR